MFLSVCDFTPPGHPIILVLASLIHNDFPPFPDSGVTCNDSKGRWLGQILRLSYTLLVCFFVPDEPCLLLLPSDLGELPAIIFPRLSSWFPSLHNWFSQQPISHKLLILPTQITLMIRCTTILWAPKKENSLHSICTIPLIMRYPNSQRYWNVLSVSYDHLSFKSWLF